jgi:hypothetical protein
LTGHSIFEGNNVTAAVPNQCHHFSKFKTAVRNSVSPPSFKQFVQFLKQLLDHSVASKAYIDPIAFYQVAQLDFVSSPTLSVDTVLFDT